MRFIYTVLFYLALPLVFLRLLWRSRKNPAYRKGWGERLGFYPFKLSECIWIHAVSVGETIAAIPLVKALRKAYPTMPILITNMTPTGAARVKASFGDTVYQAFIPYDLPDAVNRFLNRVKPLVSIVMETELWPHLFAACSKKNIPILVANARLSEKSFKLYRLIENETRRILQAITQLAAQSQRDADFFIKLGLDQSKIVVTGNIKFDLEIPEDLTTKSLTLRSELGEKRPIWIAASTHPGEDEIVLAAHKIIRNTFPNALLILVPRHPERFSAVTSLAEKNFKTVRRSSEALCDLDTAVYVGDSMGELLLLYAASDVAFVAGSFVPVGGHNLLEPAALHKPVLSGPYLFNFTEVSQLLLEQKALTLVHTNVELAEAVIRFFQNPEMCFTVGSHARSVVEKNRGAVLKQVELVKKMMVSSAIIV